MDNMTNIFSLFIKAYHSKYKYPIYKDIYANLLLSDEEYNMITSNLCNGINYFNPTFKGDDPVRYIVDNILCGNVLARSIFMEDCIKKELKLGLKQYVDLASGYDTTSYKYKMLKCFEVDKKEVIDDKIKRVSNTNIIDSNTKYIGCNLNEDFINELVNNGYNINSKSIISMLGITYYLSYEELDNLIEKISSIMKDGSSIVFDYPNAYFDLKIKSLAQATGEDMKSSYTYNDIEKLLSKHNILIYDHLNNFEMDNRYFYDYNTLNPYNKIYSKGGVEYIFAIKKVINL